MSNDELFRALGMFNEGMQSLAVSNAITGAQKQVADLQSQQMEEAQRRQALTGVANQLTLNLSKTGAPVSQIQNAVSSIAPAPIHSAADAYAQGMPDMAAGINQVENQNAQTNLATQAANQKALSEQENQAKLAQMDKQQTSQKALRAQEDAATMARTKYAQEQENYRAGLSLDKKKQDQAKESSDQIEKDFQKAGTEAINSSSRRALGRYQTAIDNSDSALTLLGKKEELQKMSPEQRRQYFDALNPRQISELASSLDRIVTQAAPTQEGRAALTPDSFEGKMQHLLEQIQNRPRGTNQGAFVESIYNTIERERLVNAGKREGALGKFKDVYKRAYDSDPDRFTRMLAGDSEAPAAAAAAQAPAANPIVTKTLKNGQKVKVEVLPDGSFREVQ